MNTTAITPAAYWYARWIWLNFPDTQSIRLCLFRRVFEVPVASTLKIHVSADSRYRLYLDGNDIGEGPAAGDLLHYHYESYDKDSSPALVTLKPGKHVLCAAVLSYGGLGPVNEIHNQQGGLIVEGGAVDESGKQIVNLSTPGEAPGTPGSSGEWRVTEDPSYDYQMGQGTAHGYWALGFMERIDLRKSQGLAKWREVDFDDSAWSKPVVVGPAVLEESAFLTMTPWVLVPRPIPMMERTAQRFKSIVSVTGDENHGQWSDLIKSGIARVPANAKVSVILDQGELTTAYPKIMFSAGRGATLTMTYAEGFSKDGKKDKRDDPTDKGIQGAADSVTPGIPGTSGPTTYEPFRWRTFRFIQLDIVTADEALEISDISSVFTAYPFKLGASFESNHELINKLWPLCWRTARLCAQEHYTDCPYYEQLQYVGDTLIQALVSCLLSGDTRLFARAIRDFDQSRMSSGLTHSRYPSHHTQIITTFSLIYVQMVEHYYIQTADVALTRDVLAGLSGIIDWFLRQPRDQHGLVASTKWWTFVDWTAAWGTGDPTRGKWIEPFAFTTSSSTIMNLQLVGAMQSLARLHDQIGDPQQAKPLRAKAKQLQQTINRVSWSSQRNLYSDSPEGETFSEHANLLAILTDTATPARQQQLATTLRRYPLQARAGYYFEFYLAMAYTKLGRVDDVLDRLDEWADILNLGLTTMPESPHKIGTSRSDCHAWSAWPTWWSLTGILGIKPDAPGYAAIRITPRLGRLTYAKGTAMTPRGPVTLSVQRNADRLKIVGHTPEQTPCKLVLPDGRVVEHAGGDLTVE